MLSENALAVYLRAVSSPETDSATIAFDLGLTTNELIAAQNELFAARLVQGLPGSDLRVLPLAPDIALARVVYDDERTVRELQSRINLQRADYLGLVSYYNDARKRSSRSDNVEILEELSMIRDFLADKCRETRDELLIAHPTRHLSADSLNDGLPQDLEMLNRGIVRRSLYLRSNRDSPAVRRAVQRTTEAGAHVRVLPVIPIRVMCFDARTALVSRSATPDDKAAIVVRDTSLAASIRQVFLAAWELAEPFAEPQTDAEQPSQLDRAILSSLGQGLSDEQIARRQDISVRTCRRHIHLLTEALGARSRFQAGLLAAKRGWL